MSFSFLTVFQALAAAGITPSTSKTYTLSAIQKALTTMHGASVYLGCSSGKLNQVWYFYNVKGNAIDGTYKAVDTRKFYRLLFGGIFTDILGPFQSLLLAAQRLASSMSPSK